MRDIELLDAEHAHPAAREVEQRRAAHAAEADDDGVVKRVVRSVLALPSMSLSSAPVRSPVVHGDDADVAARTRQKLHRARFALKELDAIAERVGSESAVEALDQDRVVLHFEALTRECRKRFREIADEERGMCSRGGTKPGLHAQVQLQCAALKPRASARGELRWFGNLREPRMSP